MTLSFSACVASSIHLHLFHQLHSFYSLIPFRFFLHPGTSTGKMNRTGLGNSLSLYIVLYCPAFPSPFVVAARET